MKWVVTECKNVFEKIIYTQFMNPQIQERLKFEWLTIYDSTKKF